MIKEVYVITEGILEFYYSPEAKEETIDQAILSSGLLDAIRSFTEHTREETIDSFSMEKEKFYFRNCDSSNYNKTLVLVFNTDISEKYARSVLDVIHKEVKATSFIKEDVGKSSLDSKEKIKLQKRIEKLSTQLFATDYESDYIQDLFSNKQNIPLAFLIDAYTNQEIASFSRPKALFKPQMISEFNLFHSSLKTTLNRLELEGLFVLITIASAEYIVASIQSGSKIAIASGTMMVKEDAVIDAVLKMCHYNKLAEILNLENLKENSLIEAKLTLQGELIYDKGTPFPSMANILISTLINNLGNFFKLTTKRNFLKFKVFINTDPIRKIQIEVLPDKTKKLLLTEFK